MLKRLLTAKPFVTGSVLGALVAAATVLAVTDKLGLDMPGGTSERPAAAHKPVSSDADSGRAFAQLKDARGDGSPAAGGGTSRRYYPDYYDEYYSHYFGYEEEDDESEEGQVVLVPADEDEEGAGFGQPGEPGEPGVPDDEVEGESGGGQGGPGGPGGGPG
jgi:hypothetical protein